MLTYEKVRDKPTVLQQLTGLNPEALADLLPAFMHALTCHKQLADAKRPPPHKRQPGGGRKALLRDHADHLRFILCACRSYPVQRVQACFVGMRQTKVGAWGHRRTPVLDIALGAEQPRPERRPARRVQVLRQCSGCAFISAGTERPIQRPKATQRQREVASGKKQRHTVKHVVIVGRRLRTIKALSRPRPGTTNDQRIADEAAYRFPKCSRLWNDTGFQGSAPPGITTIQPTKRPRKGKLTAKKKARNTAIAHLRVRGEHAIGGANVYRIAHDVFRNRREGFVDLSFETACGLHNLRCDYQLAGLPNPETTGGSFPAPLFPIETIGMVGLVVKKIEHYAVRCGQNLFLVNGY
ncbi:transposase family protein [Chloroflexus sp.]|uniref:transposase family protein n=1 Tax=Chloroflexus sp. TaxID=1904827 RepID=UPI0040494114